MDNRISVEVADYKSGEKFGTLATGAVFYFENYRFIKTSTDFGADNVFNLELYAMESFSENDVVKPYAKATLTLE